MLPKSDLGNMEDEDVEAPTFEELETLAGLLRDANPRKRLKGPKGEALRELSEIEAQIADRSASPAERVRLSNRLWALNGTSFDANPGPLGAGPFAWRANRRPKGAPTRWVNRPLDEELIQRAKELLPSKLTYGAALRMAVEEAQETGGLATSSSKA